MYNNIDSLPIDNLNEIAKYISYVDVMALRWCCKHLNKITIPCFKTIITKRLYSDLGLDTTLTFEDVYPDVSEYEADKLMVQNEFMEDYELGYHCSRTDDSLSRFLPDIPLKKLRYGIVRELTRCKAVIAGSFILDCLYDTNFHNDIDIYDNEDALKNRIEKGKFTWGEQYLQYTQFLWLCSMKDYCTMDKLDTTATPIRTYTPLETNSVKLQIIPISMDIKKCISATYDLDICKSSFDGEHLSVRSWKKLIYKYDYIKSNTKAIICVYDERSEKDALTKRMNKYRSRGFDIKLHPQIKEMNSLIENVYSCNGKTDDKMLERIADGTIDLEKYYLE